MSKAADQRTRQGLAQGMKELADDRFPGAEGSVMVMDNLNTCTPASLRAAFEPQRPRRTRERLELHYTPRHGGWPSIAEIQFSALQRQGLDRRIPDQPAPYETKPLSGASAEMLNPFPSTGDSPPATLG